MVNIAHPDRRIGRLFNKQAERMTFASVRNQERITVTDDHSDFAFWKVSMDRFIRRENIAHYRRLVPFASSGLICGTSASASVSIDWTVFIDFPRGGSA